MSKLHVTLNQSGKLTKAESAVLIELCYGLMRKEIARNLLSTPSTVSKHIEHIAEKLEANSAAEIVAKAVANRMVSITLKMLFLVMVSNNLSDDLDIDANRRPPSSPRPPITRIHNRHTTPRFQRDS